MPHGSHYSRVLQLVTKTTDAFRVDDWTLNQVDQDGLSRDSPYWESSGSKGNLNEMVAS